MIRKEKGLYHSFCLCLFSNSKISYYDKFFISYTVQLPTLMHSIAIYHLQYCHAMWEHGVYECAYSFLIFISEESTGNPMVAGFQDDLDSDDDYIASPSKTAVGEDVDFDSDDENPNMSAKSVELSSDEDESRPAVKQNADDIPDSDSDRKPPVHSAQDYDLSSDENDSELVTQDTQNVQNLSEKASIISGCDTQIPSPVTEKTLPNVEAVESDSSAKQKEEVSPQDTGGQAAVELSAPRSGDEEMDLKASSGRSVGVVSDTSSVEGDRVVVLADEDVSEEELAVTTTDQAGLSDWLDQLETKVMLLTHSQLNRELNGGSSRLIQGQMFSIVTCNCQSYLMFYVRIFSFIL